jgi:hypothetical protein
MSKRLDTSELRLQIEKLQAAFQGVADNHKWVCLYMPPFGSERDYGSPYVGELVEWSDRVPFITPPTKILAADGRPAGPTRSQIRGADQAWKNAMDSFGPLGPPAVMEPRDHPRQAVVDHVNALTYTANKLLLQVLDGENQIPPDICEQIREWEKKLLFIGGWLRWLRYGAVIRGRTHIWENYPQVAATALMWLLNHGLPEEQSAPQGAGQVGVKPPPVVTPVEPSGNAPIDLSAYTAAKKLWSVVGDVKSSPQCTVFLTKHPEIRRHKPSANRLLIHAGDWNQFWAEQNKLRNRLLNTAENQDEFAKQWDREQAKKNASTRPSKD